MKNEFVFILLYKKDFLSFFAVFLIYLINWIVLLKLGLSLNKVKLKLIKIIPLSLVGVFQSLIVKHFIPSYVFAFMTLLLVFLIFYKIGKISPFKSMITSLTVILLNGVGIILLLQPLGSLDGNIIKFLTSNTLGVIIGSSLELLLPLLLLLINMIFKISFDSFNFTKKTSDFLWVLLLTILFFVIYHITSLFLWVYQNVPQRILKNMIFFEYILVISAGTVFFTLITTLKKEKNNEIGKEQLNTQLEKSDELIKALAGEQREYRNHLQVIKMLNDLGKTREVKEYVERVTTLMSKTAIDVENPIIYAVLLAEQIQVRDKGVSIEIESKTSLNELVDPVKVGEIIKLVIDCFVNLELKSKNESRLVTFNISEEDNYYVFTIRGNGGYNLEKEIISHEKCKNHKLEVDRLLAELKGTSGIDCEDGVLSSFVFKVKKLKEKKSKIRKFLNI